MTPDALALLESHLAAAFGDLPDDTRRLFHGRGRRWPGLEQITVDWLQGVVLVALFREPEPDSLAALKALLLRQLRVQPALAQARLLLQHRYTADSQAEWLLGEPLEQQRISEDGLHYLLDLGRKQNNGLFLDMRLGRQWVRAHAHQRRVLNLFAYTCGFSLAAIAGGATQVVNLDMSRAALNRGRENHRLNGHDLTHVSFLDHELFKSWGKVKRLGPYDLVIIDPPSFQKGSFALDRDYARILRRLPELLTPNGQVLACLNDPGTGPDFLIRAMQEQAPALRFIERLDNPPEFADIDPAAGLKALLFEYAG